VTIVDDDEAFAETLRSFLHEHGYVATTCLSAEELLARLHDRPLPDIIVLDLILPGMSGWEFRVVQKREPKWANIPVIALSADASAKARAIDAAAHIVKPFDEQVLLATLRRLSEGLALTRTSARARELDRLISLGAVVGGIAHEINNPLAFLLGNLEKLQRELLKLADTSVPGSFSVGESLRALESASSGAQRIASVVRCVSMFASAETHSMHVVDVHEVLESSLQVASNEIRHCARLERFYQDVPRVLANGAKLGQLFLNLILNAVNAIRASVGHDHVIKVSTAVEGDFVAIAVRDSRDEVHRACKSQIFDPLYVVQPGGVGLQFGLAVSREIVETMGGSIDVDPTEEGCSTFRVLLPSHTRISYPAPSPPPLLRARPERPIVMVVDDEPLMCDLFSAILSDRYEIVAFTSPRAALKAALHGAFDIVLCDLMMPELTGMDLYAELERKRPELARRFVFITGGAFTEQARGFMRSVGKTALPKPCSQQELFDAIEAQLRALHADPALA
jgi:CheY-like chemotaxis protein